MLFRKRNPERKKHLQARRHVHQGTAALKRGDAQAAESSLRQANEMARGDYLTLVNLSMALFQLERYHEALTYAQEATALSPDRPQGWLNTAATHSALGNLEEAEAALQRVAMIDAGHRDLHYNWATLHLRRGRLLLALAELETELAHHPRHQPARDLLAALRH
jgi:tetratricopeptide (TPR) repeat protein